MRLRLRSTMNRAHQTARWLGRQGLALTLLLAGLGLLAATAAPAAQAGPPGAPPAQGSNTLTLAVVSARTEPNAPGGPVVQGDAVTQYKYLINVDNTGNPTQARNSGCYPTNPGYPDSCDWPSIREVPGAAPIFTQGDQDDFAPGAPPIDLPDGKYLISVMAEGYKIGGAHFSVPLNGPVEVALQPHPLPAATMRIKVFEDISPVNGQFDAPAEHGLAGFTAIINDTVGQISTDVFGNPLCTTYDANMNPTGQTDCLTSDANGDIVIPNIGPLRYDVLVNAPDGETWLETTTLEGSWSWDTWLQEGGSGLDNEFVVAGEPFPWTVFGFVRPMNNLAGGSGGVKGTLIEASVYLPQQGALPYYGDIWTGFQGTKVTGPITDGWVALSDLQNGDTAVYVGPANPDGTFAISGVPDGNYLFTWWDYNLHHILDWIQVTVSNGQMYDMGTPMLTGWFTKVEGYVFVDQNKNGVKDPGEPGKADYLVVLRDRDNSEIDRMSISAITDHNGYYVFEKAYPMGSWMVLEAYNDRYYTTGVTYQVDNQPTPTTVLGNGVDVGLLPILGQPARLDWGIYPYEAGTNGGIVGTVFYDTTRNELDPRYQAVEPWAPGIPNLTMNLYAPVPCGTTGAACDARGDYELAPDGSYAKGALLNTTTTEIWEQPTDCIARDANGVQLPWGAPNQELLPQDPTGKRCIEAPLTGTQLQSGFATLDGNWGFGDGCFGAGNYAIDEGVCFNGSAPTPLPAGDYLVEVDPGADARGLSLYQVVREEDINIFGGDQYIPVVPPPACAGALHTVDVAGVGVDGPNAVDNPAFADAGGSPYEGQQKPLCDVKLVNLANGKSVAPLFTMFTEVPVPGKWKGYIIDDLTVSTNPLDLNFGEKAGIPHSPIGIYDFNNRLVTTITSDPNGVFEVLLPSTNTMNCPTPSGVCANVYYMLGNDPGQPGALNPTYNPQYRTIGASFEIYPGLIIPSDLAPTQIVPGVLAAGSLFGTPPQCTLNDPLNPTTPELFAVSQPYYDLRQGTPGTFTIRGQGFGATRGLVTLGGQVLPVTSWSPTEIVATIPADTPPGAHQLSITASTGQSTVNGLTFHVLSGQYNPRLFEVGPGRTYATIQSAIDAASGAGGQRERLVVVYPGAAAQWNPTGAYFENLVIYSPIKLQGVGPGGVYANGTAVPGSVVDGRGVAGDTGYADQWRVFVQSLSWSGNQALYEGPVVYILADDGEFTAARSAAIDGLTIQGGDQQGFPNNLTPADPTTKEFAAVQGGGIFANAYARYLQITNNVLQSNGGAYAGAIRLGTPHLPGAFNDNQNDFVRIAHNRILANGGTNLAGAVGIFSGSEGYEVAYNDICGNFSAEYGGGISHYGYSPNGKIHDNRIYFNRSYDEGGGVIIAGELPANPGTLSPGAGPVDVYANLIQGNLGNDDGGGLRFLMAGNFPYNVYNNIIANNVSTHEGGGVSLNDAPQVRFYNNTVMKNITTATSVTSNGFPAPAGLSSSRNSATLQATLPGGSPIFSNPLLFNNVFWDNRAGTFTGGAVAGIGLAGDPNPIFYWDLGVADGVGQLAPTNTLMQTSFGTVPGAGNIVGSDPAVVQTYDTSVSVQPWRGNPRFVDILMVTALADPNVLGDYHLQGGSPAINTGAASKSGINAPGLDFDGQGRPQGPAVDMGADEVAATQAAFPATAILDNFNRGNGNLGANWNGNTQTSRFRILSQEVQVQGAAGSVWWNAATFGANQEAFFRLTKIAPNAPEQALMLKLNGNPNNNNSWLVEVRFDVTTGTIQVWSKSPASGWVMHGAFAQTLNAGDILGARVQTNGTVSVFRNGSLVGSANLRNGPTPWPESYISGGGQIGVRFVGPSFAAPNDARFDDFGGGTIAAAGAAAPAAQPARAREADLALSLAGTADPVAQGDNLTYTLNVTNQGPEAAQNVTLTDNLPAGVEFVSATPSQGSCLELGGLLTCSLGNIRRDQGASVEVVVKATAAGAITNSASVNSDTPDPNADDNAASHDATINAAPAPAEEPTSGLQADLALSLAGAADPVAQGDNLTYTLNVANQGPEAAQNVTLTDNLPAGLEFVSATPSQGSCVEAGGVVTCTLGDIPNGQSAGVEIVVKATAAGAISNAASVRSDSADPNAADNRASHDTKVNAAPAPAEEPAPEPVPQTSEGG